MSPHGVGGGECGTAEAVPGAAGGPVFGERQGGFVERLGDVFLQSVLCLNASVCFPDVEREHGAARGELSVEPQVAGGGGEGADGRRGGPRCEEPGERGPVSAGAPRSRRQEGGWGLKQGCADLIVM